MSKLGWIAVGGLSVGIIATALAASIGFDVRNSFNFRDGFFVSSSCRTNAKSDATATERRWAWDGGDTVMIAVPARVRYRGGEGEEVIARGSPDALANIRVQNGKIDSTCNGHFDFDSVEITLPGRPFNRVGVAGSADIIMENVSQSELNVDISGSGSLRADGSSDHVAVTIAGSGDADLAKLKMDGLRVQISGSGNAEAAPQNKADIVIMGSGDVRLLSKPPQLSTSIMGSGRIIQ